MKNLSSFLKEIERVGAANDNITFYQLLDEINCLLLKIKFCESITEANSYFDQLDQIQLVTAKLHYKYGLPLPTELQQFIINFNLLHDQNERNRLFYEVKNGLHNYGKRYEDFLPNTLEYIERNSIKANIKYKLDFLQQTINSLFLKIKSCENLEAANYYFDLLMQINDLIAKLINIHEIKVSDQLRKFYKDFARIDDKEWRKYLFYKIKNNEYSLEGKPALDD